MAKSKTQLKPAFSLVPAAQTPLSPADAELSAESVELFVQALGGRAKLAGLLDIAEANPDIAAICDLLVDPRYAGYSLRRLCGFAHLTIRELFAAYRSATLIKAQILAQDQVAQGLQAVVADVVRRAAPYEEVCDACQGVGTLTPDPTKKQPNPLPTACKPCKGSGVVRHLPDLENQKIVLQLAELLKTGGGISLTQQNATLNLGPAGSASGSSSASYEALQQALTGVLSVPPAPLPAAGLPIVEVGAEMVTRLPAQNAGGAHEFPVNDTTPADPAGGAG